MKLRWSKAQRKYLNEPIPVAKADYDWMVWAIIAVCSLAGLWYLFMEII